MNWVDIAQIVSALATTGALIFVTRQTKHSRDAVSEAQRMHALESGREKRAADFDAQRQAAQIVAWPVKADFQVEISGDSWLSTPPLRRCSA